MIDLLLLLLRPALRYTDDKTTPWWRLDLFLCALAAFTLDVLIAHTTWVLVAGWPKNGEWTISHTLERLCHPDNAGHPDYKRFYHVAWEIERISPGHIKVFAIAVNPWAEFLGDPRTPVITARV